MKLQTATRPATFKYKGVTITETPIRNQGIRTGTRFSFTIGKESRQAFSVPAVMRLVDGLLAAQPAAETTETNSLTDVATMARKRVAMRGTTDLKSDVPFGG